MRGLRRWRLALATLLMGGAAFAHGDPVGPRAHRLIAVEVTAETLDISVSVRLMPGDAKREREGADANHDGILDENESNALAESVRTRALETLSIELDGKPLARTLALPAASIEDPSLPEASATVRFGSRLDAGPGEHRLVLHDEGSRYGGDFNVRADARRGAELLDGDPHVFLLHRHDGHRHDGEVADTSPITLRFRGGGTRSPVPWIAFAVAIFLLGAGIQTWLRRRRAPSRPSEPN